MNFGREDFFLENAYIFEFFEQRPFFFGSDYFNKNFQVKENKMKMRKYSSALFPFAF